MINPELQTIYPELTPQWNRNFVNVLQRTSNSIIMRQIHKIKLAVILFFAALSVSAHVRLPQLVSDGMVLQRDVPVKIWGWASPGEKVTVSFIQGIAGHARNDKASHPYVTQSDTDGKWEIQLPPQKPGGPYTIKIDTIEIRNILIGDIWLCSGQSNMETPVSRVITMFGNEIRTYSNPNIHYVKIPLTYNFHGPQDDLPPCSWVELNPETAPDFSAVAYFFAKELYEKTNVPIGLINSSVGGSPAEAWISEEALKPFPALLNDMRLCQSDEFVQEMLRLASLPGQRWNAVLNKEDKGLNEAVKWYSPQYDDRLWAITNLLNNGFGIKDARPVNGVFWFRKEIELPQEYENQPAMLYMGRIVDADSVFINGICVGTTGYQYPPRNYTVPANVLKGGKNQITVRLVSQAGFSEFVTDKPYKLVFPDREVSLKGPWKYNTGALMPPMPGGGITFQYKPTGLYNAMIAPLKHLAVKGVIWYQGESNTGRYNEYYDLMTTLISDWRNLWGKDLPFISVQLANFMKPALLQQQSDWAELREIQRKLYQTVPNTGMAVAIDLGEWNDIHPLNKKEVGKRLALQARSLAYGEKIFADGPVYQSNTPDSNRVILSFKTGTDHLKPVNELKGFALAGPDGIFKPAQAIIDDNRVIVRNDKIAQPVKVRYAWADNPEGANLYNQEGLPASPFQCEIAPCLQTAKLSRTAQEVQTFNSNSDGDVPLAGSSYGYEMWTEGGNNNSLLWFGPNQGGGAAFRTEWNNAHDYLGRVGFYMDQGKPYTDYKNLYADYNYTRSANGTGGGYSYIGVYGWTKNPLVEWYVVEDWYNGEILANSKILGTYKGDFTTSDGVVYKIYRNVRPAGSGNILDDGQPFPQYFSVRQRANNSPETPICGSVAITEHFKEWEKFDDMKMGNDLYEVKFLVEAGGGTGWFEASYLKLSKEDLPRK